MDKEIKGHSRDGEGKVHFAVHKERKKGLGRINSDWLVSGTKNKTSSSFFTLVGFCRPFGRSDVRKRKVRKGGLETQPTYV